jgi:hypothetical protein
LLLRIQGDIKPIDILPIPLPLLAQLHNSYITRSTRLLHLVHRPPQLRNFIHQGPHAFFTHAQHDVALCLFPYCDFKLRAQVFFLGLEILKGTGLGGESTGMLDFESGEFFAKGFGFVCA